MPTILITGGTGLIGTALSPMLASEGFDVIILTRQKTFSTTKDNKSQNISYAHWDIDRKMIDKEAVEKSDFIVHLAGANVAEKRWTKNRKREIVESREKSGEFLVTVLREIPNKVQAVVSASGIGWYGQDTARSRKIGFHEDDPVAGDFLGTTCRTWESSIEPVKALGKRLIIFRQGIVLSNEGGALNEFKKPLKFGLAPILANGSQVISWIHVEDLCRMYLFALRNNITGSFNAVSPQPVSNKAFTIQLAKQLRGRFFIPVYVPSFVLKIVVGELSIEVLKSATVSCDKISGAGFRFLYPSVESALNNLAGRK